MKRNLALYIFMLILPLSGVNFIIINRNIFRTIDLNTYDIQDSEGKRSSSEIKPSLDAQNLIGLTPDVWNKNLTGKGITVAVLDTGISPNHDVFTNDGKLNWTTRILAYYNESIDGLSSNPIDIQWHGTWAASILGGNSSNYQGIAPEVNFIIMQLFQELDGQIITTLPILERAIDWLISNKEVYNISVVSMSFGIKPTDNNLLFIEKLNSIAETLVNEGILVVAAAGNNGNEGIRTINAPASAGPVLAVGGVDFDGTMYFKSSLGPTYEGIKKPDVCAPAVSVLGAYPSPTDDTFAYASGTSASTPFVSGLAALMLQKENNLTVVELKNIISLTSYRTINPLIINDNLQGWGIIQGYAALEALNPPISLTQNSQFHVSLYNNYTVYCQPLVLTPNHYFFELTQEDSLAAEMYLFDSFPDENGTPRLLAHSLNSIDPFQRMGYYVDHEKEVFLVLKSLERSSGSFTIKMIIELRNYLFLGLVLFNLACLVYVVHLNNKQKDMRN